MKSRGPNAAKTCRQSNTGDSRSFQEIVRQHLDFVADGDIGNIGSVHASILTAPDGIPSEVSDRGVVENVGPYGCQLFGNCEG